MLFQTTKTSTIHRLHGETERLLKTVLSFFVKPQVIRENVLDLLCVRYSDHSVQLPNDEVFVGDNTTAWLIHLTENEGEQVDRFYTGVRSFYEASLKS